MRPLLITIIITTEAVPLAHAIAFWADHGGIVGWLWAPVSLAVTLFFWFSLDGTTRYILGTAASILLLAAPLYQVAAPLAQQSAQTVATETARAQRTETIRNEIATLETQRETYLRNSETRHGWLAPLQQNNAAIASLQAELDTLNATPRDTEQPLIIVAMQLTALVLFHIAAVVALGKLRCIPAAPTVAPAATVETATETPPQHPATPANTGETLAQRIARGVYGKTPTVRAIIARESVRHPVVKRAFDELLQSGALRRNGQRYEVING